MRHLFLFLCAALVACNSDESVPPFNFSRIGLADLNVYDLKLRNDTLYAATNDGVYFKPASSHAAFTRMGLADRNVLDMIVFSHNHIIASTGSILDISEDPGLYETTNGGDDWIKLPAFGDDGFEERVRTLSQHPASPNVMYAAGLGCVARSADYGQTWELVWGFWGAAATGTSVAEVNPFKQEDFWFGGQGGIENGYLGYMQNGEVVDEWNDLLPNPTVALDVIFDPTAPETIHVGFEGGVMRTTDNGETWVRVIDEHTRSTFFHKLVRAGDGKHVFTGGWNKGNAPQPMNLYYSTDAGRSWKQYVWSGETWGGIFSMAIKTEDVSHERLFIGLQKGGVYEAVFRK